MAATEIQGGTPIESRREYVNLKQGSQVPGYKGYISQIKYRCGRTYGDQTHILDAGKRTQFCDASRSAPPLRGGAAACEGRPCGDAKQQIRNEIPKATGDNKLTEEMVSGYTGYVPRRLYQHGNTFQRECDHSIDDFITQVKQRTREVRDLHDYAATAPPMRPIIRDLEIRDHMNRFVDYRVKLPNVRDQKRGLFEAPIPGYQGFVPRIGPTEVSLGLRYHEASAKGLAEFGGQQLHHASKTNPARAASLGASLERTLGQVDRTVSYPTQGSTQQYYDFDGRRVYKHGGMVPRYTGYMPQIKYDLGHTYGDTSRSLDVCKHDKASYGMHLRTVQSSVA